MINLHTRFVGHTQYCFADPTAKLASGSWSDTIPDALCEHRYAEFNPDHSCFTSTYRPILASFDTLPTLDSHPELFI